MSRVGPQCPGGGGDLKEFMSYPTLYPNHTNTYLLMFLRKVYYDNHSKYWSTSTLCGQNEVFFILRLVLHVVTTVF